MPAWTGFAGAAQVRRAVTGEGKKTAWAGYLMTSGRGAGPAALAARVRGHRETRNRLHEVRDVTDQEDKSLVRKGNMRRVMVWLRSVSISCCAWAARLASPPLTAATPAARSER